jgi:two-component system response regulator MprA
MSQRILIVDDELNITDLLRLGLQSEGYDIETCGNGLEAVELAKRLSPDLIILDVMLPLMNGLEVCRRVRALARTANTPILILSAKDQIEDRVTGLEVGADDYLAKPFAYRELRARVRALLRRQDREPNMEILSHAGVILDREAREVSRDGHPLSLTTREFDLLALLMANAGRVMPRAVILERVWGFNFDSDSNVIDVCLHSLRKKLGPPNLVQAIRRAGFVFRA